MTVGLIVIIEHMMNAGHISYISCYFHPDPIPGNKIEYKRIMNVIFSMSKQNYCFLGFDPNLVLMRMAGINGSIVFFCNSFMLHKLTRCFLEFRL